MVQLGRQSYPDRDVYEASRRGELSPSLSELVLPEAKRLSEVASRLGSENPIARADAATDLGAVFKRRAAATLLELVSRHLVTDPARPVRSACAWCLCQWDDLAKPAMAELIQATRDQEASVRLWSVRALEWLDLNEEEVPAVLPALAERLSDVDFGVRYAAMEGVVSHSLRL
jgi:HEAT repeat protein